MSKICPLKTYDPESYESWLASFELGTDDDGNDVYEIFKHTQIHLNNAILSNGDKVVLLESIKEDLINMGYDSSSEPVTRLEDLIKSYGTMRSNSVPMRQVINTHFDNTIPEFIKSIKNPLQTQSELASFIPIVATHINSHILTVLYAKLKEICLWDEQSKTIISDDIELTANIEGYKLSLIKILQEFTGISKPVTIDDFLPQESADNYKEIMQQAWNRISTMLQNGIIDTQITPDSLSSVINPIMAFYVLQNFDKIIDQVLSDFIVVNPAYKNSLESESTKYKVKQRERKNQSWNDDANTSDGDNIYDHLLVTFITSTKDSTSGLYLTKEFATDFLVVIKDALENQDYTATVNKPQLTNLWNAVFGIQFSIQERIEFLIQWLLLPVDNRDTSNHLADPLHDIVRKLGFGQLQALGKRLQKYQEAYKKKYQSATAVKQAEMDRTRNVGEKFISQFDKGVNGFVQITENGVSYIQSGHKFKAKQYVVDKMRTALTEILTKQQEFYFEPNLLLGTTSADVIIHLDSENIINFISIITGINLHDAEMRDRFTNAGFRMTYFIREYRKIARHVLSDNKFVHASVSDKVEEIIKRLKKNSHYIEFSDTIIADNMYHLERLFNQNGQEQAKTTIPTVSTSQTYAIDKFKSGLGANTFNYLADRASVRSQSLRTWDESENKAAQLQELGDFVQNISFAGDVAVAGKAESVKWTELNELQIVEAWIKHLYLQSSVENGVTTFQPDAASDKVKVPFVSLNNMVQDSLTTLSINELQSNIYFKQHETYYKAVERLIVNKWQVLFPEASVTSFESLAQFLNNNVITAENVADRLRIVQLTNPNFTFQHQVDYVIKTEKNPNDKYNPIQRITVNSSLRHEIQKAHNQTKFTAWTEKCFKIFLENFSQYGLNNFLPEKWDLSKLDLGQRQRLAALFDLPIDQFDAKIDLLTKALKGEGIDLTTLSQDQIKNILDGKTSGNEVVDLRVKFLYKWYLSFNTTREAFLQLYQKHYWLHKDNKSDLFEEMSGRITTGKKRNNAESATFCRLQQGLKRGVPKQIRTCTISSINTNVVNHFGDRDTLNSHDGAIYTSYILRILEKNSSTTVEMSDVAKIIGLSQSGAGFEQIKCADYAMTNVWIQNTIKQNEVLDPYSEQYFDGHLLMKKMLEVATITDTFKTNLRDHKVNIGLPNVMVNIGGRRAVMSAFLVNNDNQIVCQYTYLDDSSYVKPDDLAAALNVTHLGNNAFDIKNLYDLWCLFGAEYSEAQKEDGTFATSNGSQEWMAYLMSEYDPSLKSQMIGKIIDVQSSKSTQQFVNSKKDVWDPTKSLITGVLDTYDYGVQQDSSHLTDEDDISSLTQVITAIAINGQNAELAEELYELLGKITADQIAELLDVQKTSNKTEFYVQLGKSIAKSLSRNTVVSNASRLITESLQNIIKSNKTFAESAIPISNQQLYWFVTSELLSKLNRIIRQRFPGMAVVQNPAQGIIGLTEDRNGRKYTKTDIKEQAIEWYNEQRKLGKILGVMPISTIISQYLVESGNFADEKITKENAGKLNIGYKVRAWFTREEIINGVKQEIREYRIGEISDPFVLRDIYNQVLNGAECYIVHSAPRNLATRNTSWQEVAADGSITGNNLWLLASTQAVLKSNPSDLDKNWHRANMAALQTKNGYYPTLEAYKNGELRTVINIVDKSGEEVLPKQYAKKLGLKHSLSYIKNKGYEYFSELIENRINLTKDIVVGTYNARNKHTAFAVSTNSFDIVFTDNTEINIENNTFLESIGNGQYQLYTADGQEIVGAILPTDKCEVEYIPSETGKDIIKVKFEEKDAKGTIRLENPRFVEHVLNLLPVNGVYIGNGYGNSNIWSKDAALIKYLNDTAMASDKKNIEIEAKKTYSSFLLSLRTISARIPSQSFQSFLSNETVAFTEDLQNNGYMNIWEMWFQGSDYDIKLYWCH